MPPADRSSVEPAPGTGVHVDADALRARRAGQHGDEVLRGVGQVFGGCAHFAFEAVDLAAQLLAFALAGLLLALCLAQHGFDLDAQVVEVDRLLQDGEDVAVVAGQRAGHVVAAYQQDHWHAAQLAVAGHVVEEVDVLFAQLLVADQQGGNLHRYGTAGVVTVADRLNAVAVALQSLSDLFAPLGIAFNQQDVRHLLAWLVTFW